MADAANQPGDKPPRDAAYWASPVSALRVSDVPSGALNLNVEGRRPTGALQGFGQMWQKTYRVRLRDVRVSPAEIIKTWKENFSRFWPPDSHFYAPLTGIAPGEVALINLVGPGGIPLSTGVMVIYADEEAFTLMTPEGHMFSGWITFSTYLEDGDPVAQAQVLIRATDPIWELTMRLFGFKKEDAFWRYTLRSLAAHFGVYEDVEMQVFCVDPKLQWSQAGNVRHNAAIRTALYTVSRPFRWGWKRLRERYQ